MKFRAVLAIAFGGWLVSAGQVSAVTTTDQVPDLPSATPMTEGGLTRSPMGFVIFCRLNPQECGTTRPQKAAPAEMAENADSGKPSTGTMPALTSIRWKQLQRINGEVNRSIRARPDRPGRGGGDVWSLAPKAGDCEDYVLTKRHRLMALGWPMESLLVAMVRDPRNRPHAVLLVRTDRGDFVLDNLAAGIKPWTAVPYRWIKRQSADNPGRWAKLGGYNDEMVERVKMRLRRLASRR